jgi:ribosomal protein S18 acetylase RimI-like enzyme
MEFRQAQSADYPRVIAVINEWWGGRPMADMLPKLFFDHFGDTSYVVDHDGELAAFLIGFVSQSQPDEAYVHFVGVNPAHRQAGLAQAMYQRFFANVQARGCRVVRCVTSPVNKTSIAFHTRIGFEIDAGDALVDGVAVTSNYDGRGHDRVRFTYHLAGGGSAS